MLTPTGAVSVYVEDAGGDTTCWPMLAVSQTGMMTVATDAGLAYNANTNALTIGGALDVGGVTTITSTTANQLAVKYDSSNHLAVDVSSAGAVTLNATGASAGFTFSDAVTVNANLTCGDPSSASTTLTIANSGTDVVLTSSTNLLTINTPTTIATNTAINSTSVDLGTGATTGLVVRATTGTTVDIKSTDTPSGSTAAYCAIFAGSTRHGYNVGGAGAGVIVGLPGTAAFPTGNDTDVLLLRTVATGSAPFDGAGGCVIRTRVSATDAATSFHVYTGSPTTLGLKINATQNITIGGGSLSSQTVTIANSGTDVVLTGSDGTFGVTGAITGSSNLHLAGTVSQLGSLTAGAATTARRLIFKKTAIADNTATSVLTVTIPNAHHAALIKLTMLATVDNYHSSRCAEGMVVISRDGGDDTVAATATLVLEQIATGVTETLTLAYSVTAMTGAASATQTFDVQVTLNTSGSSAAQLVCLAELVNAESTGVTMAAA